MRGGQFKPKFRQEWFDDKQHKVDDRLRKLEIEADPNERKKLRRNIARYRDSSR
jgi:hypothetical protein